MTGWRCGWILGPSLVTAANALQSHSTSNVASISQNAALQALTGPQDPVSAMLSEYRPPRQAHDWLTADPRFECVKPAGAFYLFPRITKVLVPTGIPNTGDFSQVLLDEARVALTAGEAFDAPASFASPMRHRSIAFAKGRRESWSSPRSSWAAESAANVPHPPPGFFLRVADIVGARSSFRTHLARALRHGRA